MKVHLLKEKQEKTRLEALADTEQAMEQNHRHEREKQMLRDENNKLASDVEFVSFVWFFFKFSFKQLYRQCPNSLFWFLFVLTLQLIYVMFNCCFFFF